MNPIKYNAIETEFLNRRKHQGGGIIVLTKEDAIAMINRCKELEYMIYGIDSFLLESGTIQPINSIDFDNLENRLDYDRFYANVIKENKLDRYVEAIRYIKRSPKNLYFEVVCSPTRG